MIEDKELKKQEIKNRIIDTSDLEEDTPRSRRRQNADIFTQGRRVVILLLVLVGIIILGLAFQNRFKTHTKFKLKWMHELSEGSLVDYISLGNGFLKYSKDGAVYLKKNGKNVWVDSYEMSNPKTNTNGKYAIVFDVGSKQIVSYTKEGKAASIDTELPIIKAIVSKSGVVTALVEESKSTDIVFFDNEGKKLDITVKSKLSGDGFPTDIAISPDGTALLAAFQYLKGSSMMGRVVFYDFSEIGKNMPNRVVGGFDEEFVSSMVARVKYLDKINSVAIASDGLYFFSSKNIASPKLVKTIKAESDIEAVAFEGDRLCVVYKNTSEKYNHTLYIYSKAGSVLLKKEFAGDFNKLDMQKGYIYMTKNDNAIIMNTSGVIKYSGSLDVNIHKIVKSGFLSGFTVLGDNDFRGIVLK
ncbi:MAG: hypothetical protein KH170_01120 [Lachnospiraceae bacterium oral taxon 082]|jgi:hypothetical protein|nr:DUF5711 family protein [uncultured Lachnoanaerobaculum sp.]MBS6929347.1 hypothetical protein [Lachnospiraceae bacterium oral taxon 082]